MAAKKTPASPTTKLSIDAIAKAAERAVEAAKNGNQAAREKAERAIRKLARASGFDPAKLETVAPTIAKVVARASAKPKGKKAKAKAAKAEARTVLRFKFRGEESEFDGHVRALERCGFYVVRLRPSRRWAEVSPPSPEAVAAWKAEASSQVATVREVRARRANPSGSIVMGPVVKRAAMTRRASTAKAEAPAKAAPAGTVARTSDAQWDSTFLEIYEDARRRGLSAQALALELETTPKALRARERTLEKRTPGFVLLPRTKAPAPASSPASSSPSLRALVAAAAVETSIFGGEGGGALAAYATAGVALRIHAQPGYLRAVVYAIATELAFEIAQRNHLWVVKADATEGRIHIETMTGARGEAREAFDLADRCVAQLRAVGA